MIKLKRKSKNTITKKKPKSKRKYTTKKAKYMQIKNFYDALQNPEKYCGRTKVIEMRSSYEIKYAIKLDNSEDVLEWSSEDIVIRYLAPDGRYRRYFTDFYIKHKNGKEYIIEVKPAYQAKKLTEAQYSKLSQVGKNTYDKNMAKWKATKEWCKEERAKGRKIWFRLITETELLMEGVV